MVASARSAPSFHPFDQSMDLLRQAISAFALLLRSGDRLRQLAAQPLDALQTRHVLGPLPPAAHGWRFAPGHRAARPHSRSSQ